MLLFAADENFNHDIVRGLLRRRPNLNIALAQEARMTKLPRISGRECVRGLEKAGFLFKRQNGEPNEDQPGGP